MFFLSASMILIFILGVLFMMASKLELEDQEGGNSFECGFSSFFFSRFSFSIHFFMIGIIFLFMDLELCLLMPFFNENFSSLTTAMIIWIFIFILLMGVLLEWTKGELDWKF